MKTDDAGKQVRILVVDDHDQFRQFVTSTLNKQTNLRVIGEVQDGLRAVRQAETLQPDLILLDIGLPGLSEIDAARRIVRLAPSSRIIFLTQESSAEVVREAFSLGAWGYVLKVNAGPELLIAVESVLQGKQFVGSGLDGIGERRAVGRPGSTRWSHRWPRVLAA